MLTAFQCLAFAIYFEAAGEPFIGKFAVAEVVVNRKKDDVGEFRNLDTICDVVKDYTIKNGYKVCALSFYCDGKSDIPNINNNIDKQALEESKAVAHAMLDGHNPGVINSAMWYHRIDIAPKWNAGLCFEKRIGDHIFWRECRT